MHEATLSIQPKTSPAELGEGMKGLAAVKKYLNRLNHDGLLRAMAEGTIDWVSMGGLAGLERQIEALELITGTFIVCNTKHSEMPPF